MSIVLLGSTSGSITLQEPAIAGSTVLDLPATSGTLMVNGPAFAAFASTGTSMANSTFVKITYDSESFDTNNNFASSRFTPTVAGYYQFNGGVQIDNTAASPAYLIAAMYKNGSLGVYGNNGFAIGAAFLRSYVSGIVYLNGSTDYIELYGIQTVGTTQTSSTNSAGSYFNAALIRGA